MSSYISPAPQGDPKATGAYAVAIAATAGGTNVDGHATDSAGNVAVDRVWGNVPIQPNDERQTTSTPSYNATGGSAQDHAWATTTDIRSAALAFTNPTVTVTYGVTRTVPADNHERAEAGYAGYPAMTSIHQGVYTITQASGDGTTQTYTAPNNFLKAGDTVNITGTGLDGTNLTVAAANRYTFTVSGSGTGSYYNISGKVRYTDEVTANDGAYVGGTVYVLVPSVVGAGTANAQKVLADAGLAVTTASAATNTSKTVTTATRTSGSNLLSMSATAHGFSAGQVVIISGVDATANGTWVVDGTTTTNTLVVGTTPTSALSLTGLTGAAIAVSGTIKTQSIAAGTASVSAGAAITITPWA